MIAHIYKAFLASPSDTKKERAIVERIISDINSTLGEHHNFVVKLLTWENDTFPDFGTDGQDVINNQIGLEYDIFIGIMWKKFGTQTNRAESGTQEEFDRAYEKYKTKGDVKIMFYFNSASIPQDDLDTIQFEKVKEFKKKVAKLGGYYWPYETIEVFERDLRKHLQKHLLGLTTNQIKQTKDKANISVKTLIPEIHSNFNKYLIDPEANFAHSKLEVISLPDIYIPPDLRDISNPKKGATYKVVNIDILTDAIDIEGIKFGLIGDESSGKTANCKYLFTKYFNSGLLPVFLKGTDINNNIRAEAIYKIIEDKIIEQYEVPFSIDSFHIDRFLIIIDDFHKAAKGNNKYWPIIIKNIESKFKNIILTGNSLMPIENITKQDAFQNFDIYTILEFGPKLRQELVNNWYTLGVDQKIIDKNDILRKHDNAVALIKSIIGKNYIPAYPFYLLTILQAIESGKAQNSNYSIHGFYYELIINESFARAVKDKKEISLYYNYLTYLSYSMFEKSVKEISLDDFKKFHVAYCEKHDLTYSFETIIKTFENAKLLHINKRVYIKENYVHYFFVAKYIANNIGKQQTKDLVTKMSIRIFKDEYASIVLFVTHLSKDEFIIDELIKNANSIFPEVIPAMLQDDIIVINNLISSLPKQILELVDVDDKRQEELEEQEVTEREEKEKEFDSEKSNYDDFKLDDDISTIDFYAKITLALKTIDILGQVTKKHWGEIDGDQKLKLVMATYNLGLRTLNIYLQHIQNNSKEIIEHIKEVVIEKHIKDRYVLKEKIEKISRDFVFKLCFMSAWGITKRISNSIGYDKLKNSFERALIIQPTNSVKLIDLCIKLGYSGIPITEIEEYQKDMEKNNLSYVVLQNLIIDHMYMFDTDFKIKNKVCSLLDISMKEQLKIDATSKVKREE
jgi:hypothetical protein